MRIPSAESLRVLQEGSSSGGESVLSRVRVKRGRRWLAGGYSGTTGSRYERWGDAERRAPHDCWLFVFGVRVGPDWQIRPVINGLGAEEARPLRPSQRAGQSAQ